VTATRQSRPDPGPAPGRLIIPSLLQVDFSTPPSGHQDLAQPRAMTSRGRPRGGWFCQRPPYCIDTVAKNDLQRVPQVFLLDAMLWRRPPCAAAAALLCAAMLAAAPPACSRGHERVSITTPGEGQVDV
jgi:hypothetical protein